MHDLLLELFPYLLLLYLIDGVALIHAGQRFFLSAWGRRFRLVQGTMAIINPFPLGQSITAYGLRFIPTAIGLYTLTNAGEPPSARYQVGDFHFIAYSAMRTVETDGAKVKINQATVWTAASARQAQQVAALIKTLQNRPVEQRNHTIKHHLTESQAYSALEQRHTAIQEGVALLRPWCLLLFVTLVVLLPLTLYGTRWLTLLLPNVLLLFGLAYSICLLLTLYLHRQLHQTTWAAALLEQIGLIFSPVSAIRAIDHLTRTLYSEYEAIVVAALLLPTPLFAQQLRQELYRAACAKVLHEQTDWQEFWTMRTQMLEELGEQRGLTHAAIFAAPEQQDASAAAYCPVCHSEFRVGFAFCRDCETALQSFPVAG